MWKKLHKELKSFWDTYLRPVVEPILRQKVAKEAARHLDDK